MQITLQYETQLKRAVGIPSETVNVADGADVAQIVKSAAMRHGGTAQEMLINGDGSIRSSVLIFAGDRQVTADETLSGRDGQTLTLMSPISGG